MRVLIDENMSNRRLGARLQAAGHDTVLADDVGLLSVSDARVLAWAAGQDRSVMTRDHKDFIDLHDLVSVCGGHHPGMLIIRFDNDSSHNLTERGIVTAIANLEASGMRIADQIHVMNHWRHARAKSELRPYRVGIGRSIGRFGTRGLNHFCRSTLFQDRPTGRHRKQEVLAVILGQDPWIEDHDDPVVGKRE